MKRSTGLFVALLAVLGAAVLFIAWQVYSDRAAPAALVSPTAEPPPVAAAATATPRPAAAPPATAAPSGLSALLDPAIDPARHPDDAPLTIRFDRPIADSPVRPLTISPALSGRLNWNADRTAVTFTPGSPFRVGVAYLIALAAELRGEDGAAFVEAPSWSLTAIATPRVLTRVPPDGRGSDRRPSISLLFNKPLAGAAELTVEPAVPLETTWPDETTLTIQPAAPLEPGVTYTFTTVPGAIDADGLPLAAYRFTYTPSPVIDSVRGPTLNDPDAPLVLRFGYPMDWDTVEAALVIEPPIDAELRRVDDHTLQLIDPPLLSDADYTFSLSADVADADGQPLPAPTDPAVYRAPPVILTVQPAGTFVHPGTLLRLTFARPMAPTTADALSISPPIDGAASWEDDRTLVFAPNGGYWLPSTAYDITLDATATDAAGYAILSRPQTYHFTTGEERRLADWGIGPQTQVLDADGRRAVQFQTGAQGRIALAFDLLPLDQTGFLNRLVGDVTSGWSGPAAPIADDGLSPVASWTTETTPANPNYWGNPQETTLPADVPPGLYLLRLNGPHPANLLLALTRLTLVAKKSAGELVVWVSDLDSRGATGSPDQPAAAEGAAVPGAAVQIYAQNGRLLAEGLTDERGLARLPLPADAEPYVVFARASNADGIADTTFSALTPELQAFGEYYDWGSWDGSTPLSLAPPAYAVHVQTDRPIYRPGQTVFYKAIVRLDDDGAVSLPPEGAQVIVRLRDSRDNVVRTRYLATDSFGSVYDSFDVADGAMLGAYAVEVEPLRPDGSADPVTRQTFQVEEYRKPDFSVTVTPHSPNVVAGEAITMTIDAQYLFGEPVAGARISLRRFQLYDYYGYWGQGEDYWQEWWDGEPLTAVTDAEGLAVVTIPALTRDLEYGYWDYWGANPNSWRMAVEATIDDGSNQTVSASTIVTVHRAAEALTLDLPGFFVEMGDEAPFTATVTTTQGEAAPVAGRALRGRLLGWSNTGYAFNAVAAEYEWVTGPDGQVSAFLTPPKPGYYRLRIEGEDDGGRPLFAETYIYVLGQGQDVWWSENDSASFTIAADRDRYAPGDTARLLIHSTFAGPALLTFERAAVRRELPVMLTPPLTTVEVPILAEDAPNIFVSVNAWEPVTTIPPADRADDDYLATQSQPDARLRTASVELSVPVTDRTLTVTIATDREVYAPGDEAAVTVRVTDQSGAPVRAQVALALVDEAIFLLADDNTRPLHDAFYGPRRHRVLSYDALAPGRYLYESGMGGGGGGDAPIAPRSDFPDTAAWFPALVTDDNGEARLTIPLADNLTTWRLTARAATVDTHLGEATHTFTTHQDVIIRPLLPRGLTVGDRVVLSAVVHNYGAEPAELTVSLTDEVGLLALTGPAAQAITLEPGATRVVGWPSTVAAAGQTQALVQALWADGSGDAVELPLVARELAVPIQEYAAGDVVGAGEIAFEMPADALPGSVVTLEVGRSPAGSLLNGLEYLTGFPYGCVEQTMSRALPNAVVSRAFNQLGVDPPEGANLDELVSESAQRLYGFQHDDGGWGWWFDDDSDDYQTAWVLFGLATMAEAGHEINPGVIDRGAAYLRERLLQADPRTRAYMLYSLAAAGRPDAPVALALLQATADKPFDAFSLAALALALDAAGETEAAQSALDRLEESGQVSGDTAHWGLSVDGEYGDKTMASATRSTALALSAFVRLRPGSDLEPLLVNYLMDQRHGDGWGTTNETAYAVIALTDHLLGAGLGETTAEYAVVLNGEPLAAATLEPGELRDVIDVPFERLRPGANTLTLTAADGRRLYYALNARYLAGRETIDADGPIAIERAYLSPDTKRPLETVEDGQLVLVRLSVHVPRETSYVIIQDSVPAGLEPLNERLNTTSHMVQTDYSDANWRLMRWQDYGYNNKEIRNGRVSFFVTTLPAGASRFEYLARATHDGSFVALPAEAWAMYQPELWGRSASGAVLVEAGE